MIRNNGKKEVFHIYLAGGLKSGWQVRVKTALKGYYFLDPSEHGIDDPWEYTEWDLAAIRDADLILAYMERSNPGGYALSLELGYGHALGKPILLVEEHPTPERHRRFSMVRTIADRIEPSLEKAIAYLSENCMTMKGRASE